MTFRLETPMRHPARLALIGAALAIAAFDTSVLVQAQTRGKPIYVETRPRSWLDPGVDTRAGGPPNYVTDVGGNSGPVYGARYSQQGLLPDRFSGGRGFTLDKSFLSPTNNLYK